MTMQDRHPADGPRAIEMCTDPTFGNLASEAMGEWSEEMAIGRDAAQLYEIGVFDCAVSAERDGFAPSLMPLAVADVMMQEALRSRFPGYVISIRSIDDLVIKGPIPLDAKMRVRHRIEGDGCTASSGAHLNLEVEAKMGEKKIMSGIVSYRMLKRQ